MKGKKKQAKKEVERKNNHRIQRGMMGLGFKSYNVFPKGFWLQLLLLL
jgi:hypothetical protein